MTPTAADIQMLQTSAAIEILVVSTYRAALALPSIGGATANGLVRAFASVTVAQHQGHANAYNAAASALGGDAQYDPDPRYAPMVQRSLASIVQGDRSAQASPSTGILQLVALTLTLENLAAETYVNFCSSYADSDAKKITSSIMGVEAQHVAVLSAFHALLGVKAGALISLDPTVVGRLPASLGSAGFSDSFYHVDQASPPDEGSLW